MRDPDAYPTTLDGQGQRRGVIVDGGITATLEGFTITNGVETYGGAGLYARDAVLILRGMTFYSNVIDVSGIFDYVYGGGVFVEGGVLHVEATTFRGNSAKSTRSPRGGGLAISHTLAATVTGSLFIENDAWHASGVYFRSEGNSPLFVSNSAFVDNGWGYSSGSASGGYAGALEIENAQARIVGNTFRGNRAGNDYGAVGVWGSSLLLARNVITGSSSGRTGGFYFYAVSPFTVTNNMIVGNQANSPQGSAVRVGNSSGQFLHNTIAANESDYGLLIQYGAAVSLTNTILVSHTVGISVTAGSATTLEGTLWGSGAWANGADWGGAGTVVTGTVNVRGDPAFVAPDAGDYHILPTSDAAGAGVDAGVTNDIDNEPRPMLAGTPPDLGADEIDQYLFRVCLPLVTRND